MLLILCCRGSVSVQFDAESVEMSAAVDEARAAGYLQLAAEQDLAPAATLLGYLYAEGRGVSQDTNKAVECKSHSSRMLSLPLRNPRGVLVLIL